MPEKDVRGIVKKEIEELLAMLSEREGESGAGALVTAGLPVKREEGEAARPEAGPQPGQRQGVQQPGRAPPQHLREIWDRLPPETRAVLELLMWEGPGKEPGAGQSMETKYMTTLEALKMLAPGADISLKAIMEAEELFKRMEGAAPKEQRETKAGRGTALEELLPPGFLRELAAAAKQLAQRPGRLSQGPQPGQQGPAQPSQAAQQAGQQPLAPIGAQQLLGVQASPQQPGRAQGTAQRQATGAQQQPGQAPGAPRPGQARQGVQQRQTPMPGQPGAGRQGAQQAGQTSQQQGMPRPPMPRAPRAERPLEELAREIAGKLPPEQRALLELFAEKPLAQPAQQASMPGAEQGAGRQQLQPQQGAQPQAAQRPGQQQGMQQPFSQQVPAGLPGAQLPMPSGARSPGRHGQTPTPGQQQQPSAQPGPSHRQQTCPRVAQPHTPPPPPLYQPRAPSLEDYLKGGGEKPGAQQQPRIPESPEERKKLAETLLRQYAKQLEEALGLRITMRLWVREREEKRTRRRKKKQPA